MAFHRWHTKLQMGQSSSGSRNANIISTSSSKPINTISSMLRLLLSPLGVDAPPSSDALSTSNPFSATWQHVRMRGGAAAAEEEEEE